MENFKYKKSLGQNFLKDINILSKIKNSVQVTEKDLIIEIGSGHGALTKYLKEFNANLICYEIDERTKDVLLSLADAKTKIIYKDFLNADILSDIENIAYEKLYIIANLPYYITTPIIERIIDLKLPVEEMVLMVQKEVAERFSSSPKSKSYGSITVYLNYYFEIKKLFDVNRTCFVPVPNVDSSVISLKTRVQKFNVLNEEHFFKLVKDSFRQKRKNIRNNLINYNLDIVKNILEKNGLSLMSRAEEMEIDVFVELSNALISQL